MQTTEIHLDYYPPCNCLTWFLNIVAYRMVIVRECIPYSVQYTKMARVALATLHQPWRLALLSNMHLPPRN